MRPALLRLPAAQPSRHSLYLAALAVFSFLLPSLLRAEDPAVKDHFLFMGTDVLLPFEKEYYPVVGVVGGSMQVRTPRKVERISTLRIEGFRFVPSLKLTTTFAQVSDVKVERAYTPENDPQRKMLAQLSTINMLHESQEAGEIKAAHAAANAASASNLVSGSTGANAPGSATAEAVAAASAQLNATAQTSSNAVSRVSESANIQGKLDDFDAIEVSFEISSEHYLEKPYLLMITHYRAPDDNQNQSHNWIYAESLGHVGAKPEKMTFKIAGLPQGFKILDYKIHIYDRAREVATSVSEKRVGLTKEEAFKYSLIQYKAGHKKDTRPPSLALVPLPPSFRGKVLESQLKKELYVRVDAAGFATKVSGNEAETEATDPYVEQVVRDFRYLPALKEGAPVEGTFKFKLSDAL